MLVVVNTSGNKANLFHACCVTAETEVNLWKESRFLFFQDDIAHVKVEGPETFRMPFHFQVTVANWFCGI